MFSTKSNQWKLHHFIGLQERRPKRGVSESDGQLEAIWNPYRDDASSKLQGKSQFVDAQATTLQTRMTNNKGTVLITGANGGLGSAFTSQFLQSPEASIYTGLFAVRNPSTATTLHSILSKSPNATQHEAIALDISTLASVRSAAKIINDRVSSGSLPPIRALVLNAAIRGVQRRVLFWAPSETSQRAINV